MSIETIEADENTAYDEVMSDLKGLTEKYVKDARVKKIFLGKLDQLRRLIDGGDAEGEDE